MLENRQYLQGNFRGALEEYLISSNSDETLSFESKETLAEDEPVWVTTCSLSKGTHKGSGYAQAKKTSIHLACLHLILNMGIVTKEQHLENHATTAGAQGV